jgi:hypothetical protein
LPKTLSALDKVPSSHWIWLVVCWRCVLELNNNPLYFCGSEGFVKVEPVYLPLLESVFNCFVTPFLVCCQYTVVASGTWYVILHWHLLAWKPNLENVLFIQTDSFKIFTCTNPILLVPSIGQVG